MTGPNIPLLRKYVEWVEEQDRLTEGREWRQSSFRTALGVAVEPFCGTTFCIAGKVAADNGWAFTNSGLHVTKHGDTEDIDVVAAALLGLDPPRAWDLFNGDNTAIDVRRIAEDIAGEKL